MPAGYSSLAALFGTDKIDIDLKVSNRARIVKAYGSLACKGSNMPDRPWRISRLLSSHNTNNATPPIELLHKLAELKPEEPTARKQSSGDYRQHGEKLSLLPMLAKRYFDDLIAIIDSPLLSAFISLPVLKPILTGDRC